MTDVAAAEEPAAEPVTEPVEAVTEPAVDTLLTDKPEVVGAPETYGDFTFPEGIEVDEPLVAEFSPLAKEMNLSQENAQKLIDFYNQNSADMNQAQDDAWNTTQKEWQDSARSDKEIGGGAFDEALGDAQVFLKQFGTPELSEALVDTGMGNHPEIIRVFARAGKAIGEDKISHGGSSQSGDDPWNSSVPAANRMFPDMN